MQSTFEITQLCSQKLGRDGISAIWAEAIFEQIKKVSEMEGDHSILIDHLRTYQLPNQKLKSLEEMVAEPAEIEKVRQEMMGMFDPFRGVTLPTQLISCQNRFLEAAGKGRMTFYPNSFITPTLFQFIGTHPLNLISGKQGVSKSTSLLLAWHLSSITTKFRFHHPSRVPQLVQKKLLTESFWKILYISFRNQNWTLQHYIQLLKCQCPEAQSYFEQNPWEEEKLYVFFDGLDKFYRKYNIKCCFALDELNALTRRLSDCNLMLKKQLQGEKLREQEQRTKKCTQNELNLFGRLYSKFYTILLSSVNINQVLLSWPRAWQHLSYTLYIKDQHFRRIWCNYDRKDKINMTELYRLIWYSSCKLMTPDQGQILEQQFIEVCDQLAQKQKEVSSLMTPLVINRAVQARVESFNRILEQKKKFEKEFAQLIEGSENAQILAQKVTEFVKKQYKILTEKTENSDTFLRMKIFIKTQLPSCTTVGQKIYLEQKALDFVKRQLQKKDFPEEKKEILLRMKKLLQQKLQLYNLDKISQAISSKIQVFAQRQITLSNKQKHFKNYNRSMEQLKRMKDFLQDQVRYQGIFEEQLWKQVEFMAEKEVRKQKKQALSNLRSFFESTFCKPKYSQTQKTISAQINKFVEKELKIKNLPQVMEAMKQRIIQLAQKCYNPQHQLTSSEEKAQKIGKFIDCQLNLGNLPRLTLKIQQKIHAFVNQVLHSIEEIGVKLAREKALRFYKQEKDPRALSQRYAVALACGDYYEKTKESGQFKEIPFSTIPQLYPDTILENYNKEFFEHYRDSDKLSLSVSVKQLESVSMDDIIPIFKSVDEEAYERDLFSLPKGIMIGHLINSWVNLNPRCTLTIGKQQLLINGFKNFLHFDSSQQKLQLKSNLKQLLGQAHQLPEGQYCLGRPVTQQSMHNPTQTPTSDHNSKFDLVALRKNTSGEGFEIVTIEFAVDEAKQKFESRRQEASSLIAQLLENNAELQKHDPTAAVKISSWKHILACRRKFVQAKPIQKQMQNTQVSVVPCDVSQMALVTMSRGQDLRCRKLRYHLKLLLNRLNGQSPEKAEEKKSGEDEEDGKCGEQSGREEKRINQ